MVSINLKEWNIILNEHLENNNQQLIVDYLKEEIQSSPAKRLEAS